MKSIDTRLGETKEHLHFFEMTKTKLDQLKTQRDQVVAQFNQIAGAITILEQIEKEEADRVAKEKALEDMPVL